MKTGAPRPGCPIPLGAPFHREKCVQSDPQVAFLDPLQHCTRQNVTRKCGSRALYCTPPECHGLLHTLCLNDIFQWASLKIPIAKSVFKVIHRSHFYDSLHECMRPNVTRKCGSGTCYDTLTGDAYPAHSVHLFG